MKERHTAYFTLSPEASKYMNHVFNDAFDNYDFLCDYAFKEDDEHPYDENECEGCEFFVDDECQLFDDDDCKSEEEDFFDDECEDNEFEEIVLDYEFHTIFGCCGVMFARLENGHILAANSYCPNPDYYDEELSFEICFNKIMNRIEELKEEGYCF